MHQAALPDQVAALAQEAGFSKAGIAPVPSPGDQADYPELSHFEPWIERGRAGEMQYLKRRDDGQSPAAIFPADCLSVGAIRDRLCRELQRGCTEIY